MRGFFPSVLVAAILFGSHSTARSEEQQTAKVLKVHLRLYVIDFLTGETEVLKQIAEHDMIVLENRSFAFMSGGEVVVKGQIIPIGTILEGALGAVKDGEIQVDSKLSYTTVIEKTEHSIRLLPQSKRVVTSLQLGKTMKFSSGNGTAQKQAWVDLSVEEVKP